MKLFVIVTGLFALSACAEFPNGTKAAPGFPNDQVGLSHNTNVPGSPELATPVQLGR